MKSTKTKSKSAKKPIEKIRLNKFLSQWGSVSRRQADALIKQGQVFINSSKIHDLSTLVDPKKDKVRVKKRIIRPDQFSPIYIIFNKPENVLTATEDNTSRPTVMDFIGKQKRRVFPVGRLDWATEGLLLFTNDGEFAQQVLHPKYKINKTYLVKIKGKVKQSQLQKLLRGVSTPRGRMSAQHVKILSRSGESNQWIQIVISEGKNRQIRLMLDKLGYKIIKLRRVTIGKLKMGKLKKGSFKAIKKSEAEKVFFNLKRKD